MYVFEYMPCVFRCPQGRRGHGTELGSLDGSCELVSVSPETSKEAVSTCLSRFLAPHSGFLLSLIVQEWQSSRTIVGVMCICNPNQLLERLCKEILSGSEANRTYLYLSVF